MFCHLSPNCPLAVGGGSPTQKFTLTVCPTPMGLGEMLQKENVGIFNGGECALVNGISIVEADIESIKNIAITNVVVFFLEICIFLFLPLIF
jgi:hypothetical protein